MESIPTSSESSLVRRIFGLLPATLLVISALVILFTSVVYVTQLLRSENAALHQGDYGVFAEMTRTITSGRKLYVDYWDTKPPTLFFALAPFVLTFGTTLQALHIATLVFMILFVAVIAALAHELTQSRIATTIAALLAILYTMSQTGPETTFVMALFGTTATYAAVRARGRAGWLFLAGILFTAGCFAKQPLVFVLPSLCVFAAWKAPNRRWMAVFTTLLGVAFGGGVVLLWALSQGILDAMIYRVVDISSQYVLADDGGWHFRADSWALFETYFLGQTLPVFRLLFIFGTIASVTLFFQRASKVTLLVTFVWLALSFLGAAMARAWRADYFIQTAPPLIILIALASTYIRRWTAPAQTLLLLVALGYAALYIKDVTLYNISRLHTDGNEQAQVIEIVERETTKDDCLWTWGTLGYFNYLAQRNPCMSAALDGFVMDETTFPIRETRQENMKEFIEAQPALYITERIWGFYPSLDMYARRYIGEQLHAGPRYDVYTVDRSMWHEADANFGDEIRFVGYDLLPVDGPYCLGDTLTLAMTWQQIRTPSHQYQMFIQLLTQDEQARIAGYDGPPEDDRRSNATNTWVNTGEYRLSERFDMPIDADAEPGTYKLVVGLYDVETAERVQVLGANGENVGSYAILQNLDVERCDG